MISYEGLFYLVLGVSVYVILLLSLRLISSESEDSDVVENESNGWHSKEELVIVDIINETHDIKTFRFKRKNGKGFMTFLGGQFLSFQIKDDNKLLRSYSISGSCENRSTLQVSIKKLNDGVGSGWFHSLEVGDSVFAFPPGGLFSDDTLDSDKKRIFVGGGIGITPLLSMIKTNIDRSNRIPLSLFYGMNSVKDMAFHKELQLLEDTYDNFSYFPILSNKDESWSGDTGFISYDYITSKLSIDKNDNFYFCGPPVMTDSITYGLIKNGHVLEHIHSEKFASPVAFNPDNISAVDAEIIVDGKTLAYSGKDSLLEFLEASDIDIDFACRSGVCGACKCKVIEGDVDAFTDSGLTPKERSDGYVLTCVARPKTNIKIEI